MPYTLPADVEERPVVIDGAGTLGRRIASVYAAGGSDVRIFDLSAEQLEAARDYVEEHIAETQQTLGLLPTRRGRVEVSDDLQEAVAGAWMVVEAVPERIDLKTEVFAARLRAGLLLPLPEPQVHPAGRRVRHMVRAGNGGLGPPGAAHLEGGPGAAAPVRHSADRGGRGGAQRRSRRLPCMKGCSGETLLLGRRGYPSKHTEPVQ